MFKFTFILSLMIIATLVWADDPPMNDCDACGEECQSLCGTKKFRLCCHNYMRRKRESDADMFLAPVGDVPYMDNVVQAFAENAHQNRLYSNDVPASTFPY